jgi:hypothetical protein
MAKVAALKALEIIAVQADERSGPGMPTQPGLQIVIIQPGTAPPKVIGFAPFPMPAAIPDQTVNHEAVHRPDRSRGSAV